MSDLAQSNYTYGKVLFWAAKATATSDTAFLVEV